MEWLTFFAIMASVVPMQAMLFMCLLWFRARFDKYEGVAVEVIHRYTRGEVRNYTRDEIASMRCYYDDLRSELAYAQFGSEYPELPVSASADEILTAYKRIHADALKLRKKYLIEGSIRAIASTLRDRYRDDGLAAWAEGLRGKFGAGVLGTSIDKLSSAEWLDDNPFVSAGLDLVAGAWMYLQKK